mgnify:CR=1 FL=1
MKRDLEHLDLKQAFHPVPEACRRALMDAARSVREEKPVKRVSYRAALIAAVILLAAMAVAYAAVRLGWIEYFSQQYGIAVPRVAQEALESSQPKTCQVGPMTFTYQQLLTDRRIVLSSAAVSLTDGGEALYADDTNVYESISAISDTVASRYSLTDHSMTWLEAAQELELPLYGVRALVELPPESDLGSSMEDALWNEDGTIVYFNMPMLAPGSAAGDVNATLYMAVTQFDPATGEALEKWDLELLRSVVPEVCEIIERIDARLKQEHPHSKLFIVKDGQAHMANLSVYMSTAVNGVAEIHSQILKDDLFKDWYAVYPERFQNKTNGITPRRWLGLSNPELCGLIDSRIGTGYLKDLDKLAGLKNSIDEMTVKQFNAIKLEKKRQLCRVIEEHEGVALDPSFLFDVQVKRLHEYKRQLLNALHIIDLYLALRENPALEMRPHSFIFGAKAAPGYYLAKDIIRLICYISADIEKHPEIAGKLKVVFLENYNVTLAERLIPASDVSEQISLAGKEASGTGNMKFMINGAVTVGTLDGANVEIAEAVGNDNIFIFGHTAEEVEELWRKGYASSLYYNRSERLKRVIDHLQTGFNGRSFSDVANYLLFSYGISDPYMCLADYDYYADAQTRMAAAYEDRARWNRMALTNVAKAGIFAADRSITEYAEKIWHLKRLDGREGRT